MPGTARFSACEPVLLLLMMMMMGGWRDWRLTPLPVPAPRPASASAVAPAAGPGGARGAALYVLPGGGQARQHGPAQGGALGLLRKRVG